MQEYWATRGRLKTGPHESRDAALTAFREKHPFKGPVYLAGSKGRKITTGYGSHGPFFDIRFHDAIDKSEG